MMTREEVAEVMTYCKKNNVSYKTRLAELGIPAWKFYDSKSRYALEQESSESKGEFPSSSRSACLTRSAPGSTKRLKRLSSR